MPGTLRSLLYEPDRRPSPEFDHRYGHRSVRPGRSDAARHRTPGTRCRSTDPFRAERRTAVGACARAAERIVGGHALNARGLLEDVSRESEP